MQTLYTKHITIIDKIAKKENFLKIYQVQTQVKGLGDWICENFNMTRGGKFLIYIVNTACYKCRSDY